MSNESPSRVKVMAYHKNHPKDGWYGVEQEFARVPNIGELVRLFGSMHVYEVQHVIQHPIGTTKVDTHIYVIKSPDWYQMLGDPLPL